MKPEIHPKYGKSRVKCACGAVFETRSTKPEILVEICSHCHPFYTGKKKLVDTTGRVERFEKLMAKKSAAGKKSKKKTRAKETVKLENKTLADNALKTAKSEKSKKTETKIKTAPSPQNETKK